MLCGSKPSRKTTGPIMYKCLKNLELKSKVDAQTVILQILKINPVLQQI